MKTKLIRVSRSLADNLKKKFPDMTDAERIKLVYNLSLVKLEVGLEKKDFKDNLGRFLYGKKKWNKAFK